MSTGRQQALLDGLWIPVGSILISLASGAVLGPTSVARVFSRKWYATEHYFEALLPALLLLALAIHARPPQRMWMRLIVGAVGGHASSLAAYLVSAWLIGRGDLALQELAGAPLTLLLTPGVLMGWFYGSCISMFTGFVLDGKRCVLLIWATFVAGGLMGMSVRHPAEMLELFVPFVTF